jgi:diadenylate cyclase
MNVDALTRIAPYFSVVCDIAIVWYLVYRGLLLIRGTRAMPMLIGLAAVAVVYFVAQPLGLNTLAWIIDNFLSSIILVIVVIFQDEIRRTLTKVGANRFIFKGQRIEGQSQYEEIGLAVTKLAKARLGGIIVIEREVGLEEFMEDGVILDAKLHRKLLYSIFVKDSPMHDGAVIIKDTTIRAAGVVHPLSANPDLDPSFGTRHRAALGITERSDALALVVSEESGAITLFVDGKLYRNLDPESVAKTLEHYATTSDEELSDRAGGADV